MSQITNVTLGLEKIERDAFLLLFDQMNDALDQVAAAWDVQDEQLAAEIGQAYVATEVENIAPENFYTGHRPSLIEAPIEKYPNCAVLADLALPIPQADDDHMAKYRNRLIVEVMCKSDSDEGEVNRRCKRTAEAAHAVLMNNRTLGGSMQEIYETPRILISNVFPRREKTSYGSEWFWQGARLEYQVQKEAALHQPSDGAFLASAGLGSFDQS